MKLKICMRGVLALSLFVVTIPITFASAKEGRHKVKHGAEVGKRVRDLKKYNSRVRAALAIFDGKHKKEWTLA